MNSAASMNRKQVGILIFDEVEVLDFCGPFEVFSAARLNEEKRREEPSPFEVFLLAEAASGEFLLRTLGTTAGVVHRDDWTHTLTRTYGATSSRRRVSREPLKKSSRRLSVLRRVPTLSKRFGTTPVIFGTNTVLNQTIANSKTSATRYWI